MHSPAGRHVNSVDRGATQKTDATVRSPEEQREMILGMFHESPGLRLTFRQAVRLFGLSSAECRVALDGLVQSGALCLSEGDQYRRP